jgi:BASS family bile acid:Na+ symporter
VIVMGSLGLELGLRPQESKEEKRDQRRALIRGLLVNLFVIPAVAVAITRGLHTSGDIALAMLLVVSAPGGRFAPHFVRLGRGDLSLGVEVTLFLAKLTVFTAPFTAKLLLGVHAIEIKEIPLLVQLVVLQLVPYFAGRWLGRHHPDLAKRLIHPARRAILVIIGVIIAVFVLKFRDDLLLLASDRGWIAVLAVALASAILGWAFGGRHEERRRAMAISANCREGALALAMVAVTFPGQRVQPAVIAVWAAFTLLSLALATALNPSSAPNRYGAARSSQ